MAGQPESPRNKMISTTYDRKDKCVCLREEDEYAGTLYGVYSAEVKEVGARKKVTFNNAKGIPILMLFCEYSECDVITSQNG